MSAVVLAMVLAAAEPDDGSGKKLLPLYLKETETYSVAVESAPEKPLELKKEPVFECQNAARSDQHGAAFLWLRDGRPAALACIFSASRPKLGGLQIMHELHALDPEKLVVKREEYNQWSPKAGLARKQLPDAAAPAATAAARLLQMRRFAQEFAGHSTDKDGRRWELRLLPTPLYRYPSAKSGIVDGALFTFVSNAGTDLEVLLVIEARKTNGKLQWEYACGRFSDWELRMERKGEEVFSSVRGPENPFAHDPLHLYRIFPEKIVDAEGKLVARIRQTPNGRQIIPVGKK